MWPLPFLQARKSEKKQEREHACQRRRDLLVLAFLTAVVTSGENCKALVDMLSP